jgi:hypothetical protein
MERIGTLIKNGLLDGDAVYDFVGGVIETGFSKLKPLVLEQRCATGDKRLWENSEFIAAEVARSRPPIVKP